MKAILKKDIPFLRLKKGMEIEVIKHKFDDVYQEETYKMVDYPHWITSSEIKLI